MIRSLLSSVLFAGLPALALAAGSGDHGHDMRDMHGGAGMQQGAAAHAALQGEAIGAPGDPAQVKRTIFVEMDDTMRFRPASIEVKAGETVRFLLANKGQTAHEMVLGDPEELKEHAAMMRQMGNMDHGGPNQAHLAAGQRGAVVWRFTQAGEVKFACLVPGHMEAGMVGEVTVQP